MTNLYLFDIDGTLVNVNEIHLDSYKLAYRDILGRDVPDRVIKSKFGGTEFEMHAAIFGELGIAYNNEIANRITSYYSSNLTRKLETLQSIKPLEGVVEFLEYLQRNNGCIGAVTGNLEQNARLILEKSELIHFFPILSCDDGRSERKQVLERAVGYARESGYDFKRIVVIGDTEKDIEAGKAIGAYTVGVTVGALGSATLERLREIADLALPGLREYKSIIATLSQ